MERQNGLSPFSNARILFFSLPYGAFLFLSVCVSQNLAYIRSYYTHKLSKEREGERGTEPIILFRDFLPPFQAEKKEGGWVKLSLSVSLFFFRVDLLLATYVRSMCV